MTAGEMVAVANTMGASLEVQRLVGGEYRVTLHAAYLKLDLTGTLSDDDCAAFLQEAGRDEP